MVKWIYNGLKLGHGLVQNKTQIKSSDPKTR